MLEKQGGVPMSNEETILRELKQCYYSEGEELTYKKDKFLMEMLVARIAGLFDEKDPIFWAGHEKSINIWEQRLSKVLLLQDYGNCLVLVMRSLFF